MAAKHYKVLFEGQVFDENDEENVKERLQKLFKADDARINRLFSGKSYALGKNLSKEDARKYEKGIMQAGGLCRIVNMDDGSELKPADRSIKEPSLTADISSRIRSGSKKPLRLMRRIGRCHYISLCWLVLAIEAAALLMPVYLPKLAVGMLTIQQITAIGLGMHALGILVAVYAMASRLHDMNRNGSLWLFMIIPIVNLLFMGWLALGRGSKGDNDYGNPPESPGQFARLLGLYIPVILLLVTSGGAYFYQDELLKQIQHLPAEWSKQIPEGIESHLPFLSSLPFLST
ncbi:hypothetical protein GZ77_11190 [Endozoicomonas montiporae]|uniref:DUF805 domain-containing protein n=2 Tax=Endozoicomonas montiporae TaxID=1027273 RepID=A0A081N8Q9_9GAMM|nr:DUF805 domain-containing protein [Endozoicomonas montiporae]AMO55262.1 hypothetical protein EZMO1_1056 [Endozoicomonas montiporae CL-33]KEQ14832.1 hypothetical protein GZ77_11190 [Endozoicomonas montiporae]